MFIVQVQVQVYNADPTLTLNLSLIGRVGRISDFQHVCIDEVKASFYNAAKKSIILINVKLTIILS